MPVRGFLQTTQSKMRKWEMWLTSPWDVRPMRGRLGGNKEFGEAAIEARGQSSKWVACSSRASWKKERPQAGRRKASKCPAIFSHLIFGLVSRSPPIVGECSLDSPANRSDRPRQSRAAAIAADSFFYSRLLVGAMSL